MQPVNTSANSTSNACVDTYDSSPLVSAERLVLNQVFNVKVQTTRFYMLRYLQILLRHVFPVLHSNASQILYTLYILEELRHIGLHLLVYF